MCLQDKPLKNHENDCYRCGMKGNWSCTYHKPKDLIDLYQTSITTKGKEIKINFTGGDGLNLTYYNIDFFGGLGEKTHHLINDEDADID